MKVKNVKKSLATSAKKALAKTVKSAASAFSDGKQIYRLFKSADESAYRLQGEFTVCALRKARYAVMTTAARGTDILLCTGAQGQALMVGKRLVKADNGTDAIQSGLFALSSAGLKDAKWFASYSALAAHIKAHGEKAESYGKQFAGLRILAGSKYSFLSDGKKVWRWEANTCARGKAFFGATF